jgi:hypothetical protein
MSAETDFERRLHADLVATLDRVDGPNPSWAGSPAAAVVAGDGARSARPAPWRLLAVAAVLVVGSVAAVVLSSRGPDEADPAIAGCPTLADYAAASADPDPTPQPRASFPPVAPNASATTGMLEPGTWAVLADENGPTHQFRLRDVHLCARLPDLRPSQPGGDLVLATVDVRILRGRPGWLGFESMLTMGLRGEPANGNPPVLTFGVPGVVRQTSLSAGEGFARSSLVIFDVPPTRASVSAHLVDAFDGAPLEPAIGWRLRAGDEGPDPEPSAIPVPGASATTGEISVGSIATVLVPGTPTRGAVTIAEVAEVSAYPKRVPPAGSRYLEARVVAYFWDGEPMTSIPNPSSERVAWAVTDERGERLRVLGDDPAVASNGQSLWPLAPSTPIYGPAWLVIEAPASGPIRLALTVDGLEQWFVWLRR